MKRILFVLLALTFVFGLCACSNTETNVSDDSSAAVSAPESSDASVESSKEESTQEETAFVVTVVDEEGNPVEGTMVQVCENDICYAPAKSDADGKAVLNVAIKDGFTLKVAAATDGYEYKGEAIVLTEGITEYTLELTKVVAG